MEVAAKSHDLPLKSQVLVSTAAGKAVGVLLITPIRTGCEQILRNFQLNKL